MAPVTRLVLENENRPLTAEGRQLRLSLGRSERVWFDAPTSVRAYILWDNTSVTFTKPTPTITAFEKRPVTRDKRCHPRDQLFKLFSDCATCRSRDDPGEG